VKRIAFLMLAAAFFASVPLEAEAQQRDRNPGQQATPAEGFSSQEREIMVRFFTQNPVEVQGLPPGIARNLARGKPLPPGIAKRAAPQALVTALPERRGMEVTIFGDRIVLLRADGLVVDVIEGILR
jgi:hypothetical protein